MSLLKNLATGLLWVLVLLSFTANAFMLRLLVDARVQAAEAIQLGAQSLGQIQASAFTYTLTINRDVPVEVVIPAGTMLPTALGSVEISEDLTVMANARLDLAEPVKINVADTPLNTPLLNTKEYLERLYTQWQRDPLQVFLAPLPQ